jgi:FtsH-binding integral membrane protein
MSQEFPSTTTQPPIIAAPAAGREAFIVRTYIHLFGAVLGFIGLELFYFSSGIAEDIARALLSVNWLLVLGGFIIVSWLARGVAARAKTREVQYLGLAGFVFAESIIFVPLLFIANYYAPGAIRSAALITLAGFTGLTAIAFQSRKDFSFLGGMLKWAGVLALVAIVGAVAFGFNLGTWFSVAMIGLAGGAILHDTSAILRHFPEDAHVAAALELFASVALMFWYVLRLLSFSRD